METKWIIIVVSVFVIGLVVYLIKRNQKDKDEVIKFLNETEINDNNKPIEDEID